MFDRKPFQKRLERKRCCRRDKPAQLFWRNANLLKKGLIENENDMTA
jgi:hypothetical protein